MILSTGWGACVVAGGHMCGCQGGVHGGIGGMHGCLGVCVVAGGAACVVARGHVWWPGGHAWLPGGMHGWGVHGCRGACMGYDEIQSMSGRYASYWNAFLLYKTLRWCGP